MDWREEILEEAARAARVEEATRNILIEARRRAQLSVFEVDIGLKEATSSPMKSEDESATSSPVVTFSSPYKGTPTPSKDSFEQDPLAATAEAQEATLLLKRIPLEQKMLKDISKREVHPSALFLNKLYDPGRPFLDAVNFASSPQMFEDLEAEKSDSEMGSSAVETKLDDITALIEASKATSVEEEVVDPDLERQCQIMKEARSQPLKYTIHQPRTLAPVIVGSVNSNCLPLTTADLGGMLPVQEWIRKKDRRLKKLMNTPGFSAAQGVVKKRGRGRARREIIYTLENVELEVTPSRFAPPKITPQRFDDEESSEDELAEVMRYRDAEYDDSFADFSPTKQTPTGERTAVINRKPVGHWTNDGEWVASEEGLASWKVAPSKPTPTKIARSENSSGDEFSPRRSVSPSARSPQQPKKRKEPAVKPEKTFVFPEPEQHYDKVEDLLRAMTGGGKLDDPEILEGELSS